MPSSRYETLAFDIVMGLSYLGFALLPSPARRRWVRGRLARLGQKDEQNAAACVAALVNSGGSARRVLANARNTFTGIPFSALAFADFESNADTGLNKKIVKQRLGDVDAFLSRARA